MLEIIMNVKEVMDNFVIIGLLGCSVCFLGEAVKSSGLLGKKKAAGKKRITCTRSHDSKAA